MYAVTLLLPFHYNRATGSLRHPMPTPAWLCK
jgi:hypothetical protein